MQMTSTRAALVGINDFDAEFAAVTATIPRAEVEEAVQAEEPPELVLEVQRQGEDDGATAVSVEWKREDLERLLRNTTGDNVTLVFRRDQLEEAVSTADVEAHGLRERMLVLTVAAATAAAAGSSIASAAPDSGVGSGQGAAATSAVHDEAGLATRGIEATAGHDEAGLASRGIEAQQIAASHDEAALASRGITPAGTHDEASLASRGIEVQPTPATHDEASLVSRGIVEAPVAVHDEASLVARGIDPQPLGGDDTGFEFPTVDATTAAVATGVGGGIMLLITAAGFAARRDRMRPA
jgi:hypothetical protein